MSFFEGFEHRVIWLTRSSYYLQIQVDGFYTHPAWSIKKQAGSTFPIATLGS
jgi:hypothetical protein